MSGRTFTPDQLPRVTKDILNRRSVLQIVSATDDDKWASERTWEFARAAAAGERRVALIDLSLEEPVLDDHATKVAEEGIVDAFLYGVSLSHVAQPQDVGGLYYVGVGTRTGDPAEVWSSSRWERLARGFRNEGAILIAFVPAGALNRCALESDGLIVLSPKGYDPATDVAPGIARKLRAGTPLLGVITDKAPQQAEPVPAPPQPPPRASSGAWDISGPVDPEPPGEPRAAAQERTPAAPGSAPSPKTSSAEVTPVDPLEPVQLDDPGIEEAPSPEPEPEPIPTASSTSSQTNLDHEMDEEMEQRTGATPRPRPTPTYSTRPIFEPTTRRPVGNTMFWIGGAIAVAAVAVGFYWWNQRAETTAAPPPQATALADTVTVDSGTEASVPRTEPDSAAPIEPEVPAVVLTDADSLFYSIQAAALNTIESAMEHGDEFRQTGMQVTVSPVRVLGSVWYRVILGAYPTNAVADSVLRALWRNGLVEDLQGTILRTPQAFDLGSRDSYDSAQAEAQTLWDRGIPATALPAARGAILSVGAFERPAQASIAESLLSSANVQATLGPRMGTRR